MARLPETRRVAKLESAIKSGDDAERLTPEQREWLNDWRGRTAAMVAATSPVEAWRYYSMGLDPIRRDIRQALDGDNFIDPDKDDDATAQRKYNNRVSAAELNRRS